MFLLEGELVRKTPTTTPTGDDATNTNATVWPTTKPSNSPVNVPTSPSISPTVPVVDTPSPSPVNTTTNDNMPNAGAADGYIIPLMAFIATLGIISFVNYTITGVVFAKSNFEYSVYTPESFQKLQSDTPRFSDGSNILFIVDYSNSIE